MNIAMGAKIVCSLISGENEWWKQALKNKYLRGKRLRSIEKAKWEGRGSGIWQVCKLTGPLIQGRLYWNPGNSKQINLCDDSILGRTPLASKNKLGEVRTKKLASEKGV